MLPSYIEILISHDKDPYQPISIMECQHGFERCSNVEAKIANFSPSKLVKSPGHARRICCRTLGRQRGRTLLSSVGDAGGFLTLSHR